MKTILIPITSNFVIRSFLRTDALRIIAARADVRVVFLAPAGKIEYYRREFPGDRIVFDALPSYASSPGERLWRFFEIASIHTRTTAIMQRSALQRYHSRQVFFLRFAAFLGKSALRRCGRFRLWRRCIRVGYWYMPADPRITMLFEKYHPDFVYAPAMLSQDMAILKEAKKRGVKTVGMVLSWDNLYSKTLLRIHPDILLVHTASLKAQAETLGDYPAHRIRVVGIPQYDRVFRKEGLLTREQFIASLGGDPTKRLIVYALSGKAGLSIEYDIIEILWRMREAGNIPRDTEVLVRPYPRFDLPAAVMERITKQYGFLARPAMAHAGKGKDSWEFDEGALRLLVNTLHHADLIITLYSTFFIEGAVCGKPLIGIAFDGAQKNNFWNSAARFFEWDHLAEVKPLNGIQLVHSELELADTISVYLKNPKLHAEGRARIVAQQCGPADGRAGERTAEIILGGLHLETGFPSGNPVSKILEVL